MLDFPSPATIGHTVFMKIHETQGAQLIHTNNNKYWRRTIYKYLIIGFEKRMLIISGMDTSIFLSLLEKLDWYCVSKMFYRYSHPFLSFIHSLYFLRKSTKEVCIVLEDITFRFEK